ncbi:MAG: uracil phosphoribosyltransferase [Clostridia bacterium]|nr:uracil phosphoribosyltransferase [Clostridia bacterium]
MDSLLKNTVIIDHPLIAHKVTHLRDVYTGSKEFCEMVNEITMLMGYEALRDLSLKNVSVTAPLRTFDSPVLAEDFTIVPILRAGLGMVDGLRSLSPTAKVGHIGLYRDEKTLEAKEYYFKLPADADKGQCLIVDPALATGATAVAAIDLLKSVGVTRIKFMCIFSSLTGISAVHSKHPDVAIYTASYSDEPLNDKGYIYTAAGDAGDRICGTVSYKPWPRG